MQLPLGLRNYPSGLRIGLRIVPFVPVIGLMALLISGESRQFSAIEVHYRWIVTGVLVSGAILSVCITFIRALKNRLKRKDRLIIVGLGFLSSAVWTITYIAADPASDTLIQIPAYWKICFALSAALMAVVSFFVSAHLVDARSKGASAEGSRNRKDKHLQ
jgi:hypothetical protein